MHGHYSFSRWTIRHIATMAQIRKIIVGLQERRARRDMDAQLQ
jgi:hypothetical protein